MDTSTQVSAEMPAMATKGQSGTHRQRRTVEEKRRIVEETLVEGASVARVARAHGVNANQVFYWRKLYQAGRLTSGSEAMKLLPVTVTGRSLRTPPEVNNARFSTPRSGVIHIELGHAQVRVEGGADPVLLRVLLECLRP